MALLLPELQWFQFIVDFFCIGLTCCTTSYRPRTDPKKVARLWPIKRYRLETRWERPWIANPQHFASVIRITEASGVWAASNPLPLLVVFCATAPVTDCDHSRYTMEWERGLVDWPAARVAVGDVSGQWECVRLLPAGAEPRRLDWRPRAGM